MEFQFVLKLDACVYVYLCVVDTQNNHSSLNHFIIGFWILFFPFFIYSFGVVVRETLNASRKKQKVYIVIFC